MSSERELVKKYKEAVETKNLDAIYPHLAEDMTYEVLPSTVGSKGDKAEWKSQMSVLLADVEFAKLEFVNLLEYPLFIVAKANTTLVFPSNPFTQGILLLFNFSKDKDGTLKIANVVEYVDSLKVEKLKAKLASGPPLTSDIV